MTRSVDVLEQNEQHGPGMDGVSGLDALLLHGAAVGAPTRRLQSLSFLFTELQELQPARVLRAPSRGVKASFEFVDGLGVGEESPLPALNSDPPESLQRIATLAAKWLTRLGANSPDLSRWAADGVDDGVRDATREDATSTSLLQTGQGRAGPSGHSITAVATHFGLEGRHAADAGDAHYDPAAHMRNDGEHEDHSAHRSEEDGRHDPGAHMGYAAEHHEHSTHSGEEGESYDPAAHMRYEDEHKDRADPEGEHDRQADVDDHSNHHDPAANMGYDEADHENHAEHTGEEGKHHDHHDPAANMGYGEGEHADHTEHTGEEGEHHDHHDPAANMGYDEGDHEDHTEHAGEEGEHHDHYDPAANMGYDEGDHEDHTEHTGEEGEHHDHYDPAANMGYDEGEHGDHTEHTGEEGEHHGHHDPAANMGYDEGEHGDNAEHAGEEGENYDPAAHLGKEGEHEGAGKEGETGEHQEGKEGEEGEHHEGKEGQHGENNEGKEGEHEGKESEKTEMQKKDEALKDAIVDPDSGNIIDGKSGEEIDPTTGQIVDDGSYIDDKTGLAINPAKGKMYDPVSGSDFLRFKTWQEGRALAVSPRVTHDFFALVLVLTFAKTSSRGLGSGGGCLELMTGRSDLRLLRKLAAALSFCRAACRPLQLRPRGGKSEGSMGQSLVWVARECWDRSSQGRRCEACDRAACLQTSSEDRVQWLMRMCEQHMRDISSRDEDLQSCRDDIAELLDHCRRLVKMAENTREQAMVIELQAKVRELQLDSRELRLLVQAQRSREHPRPARPGTQSTEPVHVLQAHSEAISQALLLRSSRIPEALEAPVGIALERARASVSDMHQQQIVFGVAPRSMTEIGVLRENMDECSPAVAHRVTIWEKLETMQDGRLVVWYFKPLPSPAFLEGCAGLPWPIAMSSFFPQGAQSRADSSPRRRSVSPTKSGRHSEKSPRASNEFVQTAVRLRPFLPNELSKLGTAPVSCVEMKPNGHVVLSDPEKPQQPGREFECTFAFDSSRPKSDNYSDQRTIYNSVGAEMVMHGTTGFNCCLIAYGQTGTGKTHTVHGDWQSHEHRGLLPRISEGLFQRLDQCRAEGASWRVRISYIEVYNDRLRDLLEHAGPSLSRTENDSPSPRRISKPGTAAGPRLEIRNHPAVGVYVENLQELPVEHLRDVARLVSKGEKAKKMERTTMNDRSSRSHTIFMFKVEVRNASNGDHMSTVQVVDLAGRENEQTSECKGDRFRELRHINRSLFDLASCIHALCDGNRDHVPFRNSKLTMLLSDSLASNSRTTLLATLTPSSAGFDENILTCRFLESTVVPLNGEPMAACDGADGDASRQVERLLGGPDPVILKLDERSFMYYIPTITGDKDPGAWYDELTAVLQNSTLTMPTPPKDTSAENERAQFYAAGTFDHAVPDAGLQAIDFRYNPRWCLAGRPLENLQCILNLKRMVEEEVGKVLAMEHESLGETKNSPDLSQPFFNSILVNFYKDGRAQIKWHADDENCYGPSDNILIGSLSFGAARVFEVRRKPRRGDTDRSAQQLQRILLQPGSLLVMGGAMQANWQHSLPPDPSCLGGRVNLTFRRIVGGRRRGEGRISTQPVVNHFGAAEVQKHLQDEIANLQSTLVEEAVIASRQTLLKQFSEVWSDHHLQALQGAQGDSRLTVVHGACRQVSSSLQGAEESLSQLEERNHEAAKALQKVERKLANVEKAIRSVQSRNAGYKGYVSGSPDSTATTAGEDRVPGEALRMSLGLALSKRSPRQPKVSLISEWRSEAAITSCQALSGKERSAASSLNMPMRAVRPAGEQLSGKRTMYPIQASYVTCMGAGAQVLSYTTDCSLWASKALCISGLRRPSAGPPEVAGSDVNLIDPCTATVSWVLYGSALRVTRSGNSALWKLRLASAVPVVLCLLAPKVTLTVSQLWRSAQMVVLSPEEQTELSGSGQSGRGLLPYQHRMRFTVQLMHLRCLAQPFQASRAVLCLQPEDGAAWRGALGESVKPGVCSMVLVQSGSNLIKADGYPAVPRYAIPESGAGTVLDVADASQKCQETTAQTRASRTGTWNESLTLSYRRSWIAGKQAFITQTLAVSGDVSVFVTVGMVTWVLCVLLSVQFATQPYLTRKFTSDGLIISSYVAAAELLKLVASLCFLVVAGKWHRAFTGWTWRIGLRESIWPAMAYALQNVAGTAANKSLDAVTCNVLNQTKLLWTAAFVVLRKQRQFTFREWVALTMILLASVLTACDGDGLRAEPYWVRCQGVACACLAAMCSAFGAVLTEEALVKGRDPFLLSAELALGGLGTLFVTFPFTMLEQGTAERFCGWTWATLLPLFTHAGGGILVGIVTKHLGSVNKAILMVVSLLLTGTLKVLIDHRWPSAPSMLSIGLVAAGLALYCDLGNRIVVFCQREKPMFDVLQPLHLHCSWYRTLLGHPRRPQPLKVESFHWVQEYSA
ncbi:Kinesin-like protein KIF1A [Symbiodinium microadriaticum]|uniref:Kinesin-like protein KIF1A n=1 Tax=Symbiodinium microadriaticum TaxID=2951 RepID=A0A1Q9DEH0_SYMMI|nr:Kinesin-like protein KIF1A [Symbiodinium microadriaticum]